MPNSNLNLDEEIGGRVRSAAKLAGVTHEELALEARIPLRTFGYLVAGKAHWKVANVAAVADALGLDLHDLLMGRAA